MRGMSGESMGMGHGIQSYKSHEMTAQSMLAVICQIGPFLRPWGCRGRNPEVCLGNRTLHW